MPRVQTLQKLLASDWFIYWETHTGSYRTQTSQLVVVETHSQASKSSPARGSAAVQVLLQMPHVLLDPKRWNVEGRVSAADAAAHVSDEDGECRRLKLVPGGVIQEHDTHSHT